MPTIIESADAAGVDLKPYPWDQCIRDQTKRYGSKERAEKICGYIKEKYGASAQAPAEAHLEAAKKLGFEPEPDPELVDGETVEAEPPNVTVEEVPGLSDDAVAWIREAGTDTERPDNPPAWATDKRIWERAKAAVKKYWSKYAEPWAVVAYVYQRMHGRVKRKASMSGACRGQPIMLASPPAEGEGATPDPTRPRWVQVAYEGKFAGHWSGMHFEFTPALFDTVIANFRSHPAYRAGAAEAPVEEVLGGAYDVVPYDFDHASEMPATAGQKPVVGAPAQGWVCELEKRTDDKGKTSLYAFSRFIEPAATYLAEKRYKWTSVSVVFDAKDPVSGKEIGPVLTSVAITNQPFLQDLQAIAASNMAMRAETRIMATADEDLLRDATSSLRWIMGLPTTATPDEIAMETNKLRRMVDGADAPPKGVDPVAIVGMIRNTLGMPALASVEEVFAELDKLYSRLASAVPKPDEGAAPVAVAASNLATIEEGLSVDEMAEKIAQAITRLSGASQQHAPSGAQIAADTRQETIMTTPNASGVDLRAHLAQRFAERNKVDASTVSDVNLLLMADSGLASMDQLASILEGLGAKDVKQALAKVAEMMGITKQFEALMPKYQEMQKRVDDIDTAEAMQDAEMALASFNHTPQSAGALFNTLLAARKSDRDAFRKDYGLDTKQPPVPSYIGASIATVREDAPSILGNITLGSNGQIRRQPIQPAPAPGQGNAKRVDLSGYQGANDLDRAITYLSQQPENKGLEFAQVHEKACEFLLAQRRLVA